MLDWKGSMRVKTKRSEKDRCVVTLARTGMLIAYVGALFAAGGCSPPTKPIEPSAVNDGPALKRADVLDPLDEPARRTTPSPPELTDCTRIEVKYYPSTLRALGLSGWSSILSPEESRYIESLKTIVITDADRIKVLAQRLRSGSYDGTGGTISMQHSADIIWYRGEKPVISFRDYGCLIRTRDGHWFRYAGVAMPTAELTPQVYPFYLRGACATNLSCMGIELRTMVREGIAWPAPDEWCDVLPRRRLVGNPGAADRIAREFVCPGGGEGKCHYAMNPACKPDSPPNTVLLFETQAGWNQHGGPELFTFDNHDPKGGLVLLNDGKVKFIRTEEELKQLRWK
jgi:hypothetical protein